MASSQPNSTSIQIDMDRAPGGQSSDADSFVGSLRGRLSYAIDGIRRATEMMPNSPSSQQQQHSNGPSISFHADLGVFRQQPDGVQQPHLNLEASTMAASMLAHHHFVPYHHTAVTHMPQIATATIGHNHNSSQPTDTHQQQQQYTPPPPNDEPRQGVEGAGGGTPEAANQRNVDTFADAMAQNPELRRFIMAILKTLPYLGIILLKVSYDKCNSLFNLLVVFGVFTYTNELLCKEIPKKHLKNKKKLCFFIVAALAAISCKFNEDPYILDIILLTSYRTVSSFAELIYYLLMADTCVKSLTVMAKMLITIMPEHIVELKGRGRIYLLSESISQFYRCLCPIQPWAAYLMNNYEGNERIFGGVLVIIYTLVKFRELVWAGKFIQESFTKFKHNSNFGSTPSSEELLACGGQCPICHEAFASPIALECRHIFCDICIGSWFDRETTCPMCRKKIADDPKYRNGSTSLYSQIF